MVKYGRCNHVVWENDSGDYVLLVISLKYCPFNESISSALSISKSYLIVPDMAVIFPKKSNSLS